MRRRQRLLCLVIGSFLLTAVCVGILAPLMPAPSDQTTVVIVSALTFTVFFAVLATAFPVGSSSAKTVSHH